MAGQLLVRLYNVGLGDCIYLRIPDSGRDVHVLIDCGNKFGSLDLLGQRIRELEPELPDDGAGSKRLDLLVVTHPHEDHHKGFEEEFFQGITIDRIWLSPAFDLENPKAQGFHALKAAARRALRDLSQVAFGDLKAQVDELLSLSKDEALTMLNETLPHRNGIPPLYATAQTPEAQLLAFHDPAIKLKVLGPMEEVDAYYLGSAGQPDLTGASRPRGMAGVYQALFPNPATVQVKQPSNISVQDFRRLRGRIGSNALALAELAGHAENNLSVVLLLEWHGRRLLFTGDAEWSGSFGGEVKRGRSNGSWNVMWQERRADLSHPLDFLKIGHHGSENATPWAPPDEKTRAEHPISQILDALLPRPGEGGTPSARAVASTQRTSRWPSIPDPELMVEIGSRVANARTQYVEDQSRTHVEAGRPQPQRTDLEEQVTGAPVPFIEISYQAGFPYPALVG
jgi:beta-lactamase superfamily II metal-dependent hydrolase